MPAMARSPGAAPSLCLLAAAIAAGCTQPALEPSFEHATPAERTMAATRAARTGDRASVPHLITMLGSDDPAQRMIAADALRRITGQTHGYDFADPPPARREAVERWAAWYRSSTGGDGEEALP